jgi:ADP-heptose:LPS heptosyltransferase
MVKRLLIYRMGSLGDTIVALPIFNLLRRAFPDAERCVLTNIPINSDAAPLQEVLGGGGFADGYFTYPIGTRSPRRLLALRQEIRDWYPDATVYVTERRGLALRRDLLFLRWCGVRQVMCAPIGRDLQTHRAPDNHGLWESEAARLARCTAALGEADIANPASWSLRPTDMEKKSADKILSSWPGAGSFAAFSIGAKIDVKSWGDDRWASLLVGLSARHPGLGLALIGGPNDRERSDKAARGWQGPVLNLCGDVTPRLSALVIERAKIFMGHDSGPMHLAASVGTPSVSVFSRHARPGIWFPFGAHNRVFYPGLAWSGGAPPVFRDAAGETNITLIPVAPVLDSCDALLRHAISGVAV